MSKQILDQENKNPAIIHVEPREAVKELLTKLKEANDLKKLLKDGLDQEILESIEMCDDKIEIIQKEIKELVSFEVQETIKTSDGQAIYRKGNKRITYDSKMLDFIEDKIIRTAIDPARKETQVKGSVTVEVY